MDILVALDSIDIKKKIDERYKDRVYPHDITYKEDVIEYIQKSNNNHVIITKLSLPGNITKSEYIEKLSNIKNNKIIILIDKLDKENKKLLFANEIFNIIEGNEIDIDLLYKSIDDKNKNIVYKTVYRDKKQKVKNKIAILGSNGSGKSFISSFVANTIAKYTTNKVILVSLDFKTPSIDIMNNVKGVNSICEYLNQEGCNKDNIYKYIINDNKYNNLSYVNIKIKPDCYNLEDVYFDNMIKDLNEKFDYIILDIPDITLCNSLCKLVKLSDEILFVINPNYINLRQSKEYLKFMYKSINLSEKNINLVINKEDIYSLDKKYINAILKNSYNMISIKYFKYINAYINGMMYKIPFKSKEEKNILKVLNIKYGREK